MIIDTRNPMEDYDEYEGIRLLIEMTKFRLITKDTIITLENVWWKII